jgi:hypothetical protein
VVNITDKFGASPDGGGGRELWTDILLRSV